MSADEEEEEEEADPSAPFSYYDQFDSSDGTPPEPWMKYADLLQDNPPREGGCGKAKGKGTRPAGSAGPQGEVREPENDTGKSQRKRQAGERGCERQCVYVVVNSGIIVVNGGKVMVYNG
jgi:hypothetical protein